MDTHNPDAHAEMGEPLSKGTTVDNGRWVCLEAAYAERVQSGHYGLCSEGTKKYAERILAMHDKLGAHECVKDRAQPDGSW